MHKALISGIIVAIIFAGGGYFIWRQTSQRLPASESNSEQTVTLQKQSPNETLSGRESSPATGINPDSGLSAINGTEKNIPLPSAWRPYSNTRVGISFQYPSDWIKEGKDAEAIDLAGALTSIEINFTDTLSRSTLLISYHPAPKGAQVYHYAVSQFESSRGWYATGGKQIKIAGNTAVEADNILHADGKGHLLDPPLRSITVDLLDQQKTGTIELQFKTPLTMSDHEVADFNRLLNSLMFTY